jgi:hypothetical protein
MITITFNAGGLPPGFCPQGWQATFQGFVNALTGTVNGLNYTQINVSTTAPALSSNYLWLHIDGSGVPLGLYTASAGNWVPVDAENFFPGLIDSGAVNALIVLNAPIQPAYSPPPGGVPTTGLVPGMTFVFKPANTTTGAATLQINAYPAAAIVKGGTTPLSPGDIQASIWTMVMFDGTNFQLLSTPQSILIPIQRVFATSGPITQSAPVGTYTYPVTFTLPAGATQWLELEVSFIGEYGSQSGDSVNVTGTFQWNTAPLTNTNVTISSTTGASNSGQLFLIADVGSFVAPTWRFLGNVPGSIASVGTITFQVVLVVAGNNLHSTEPAYLYGKATCK